MKTVLLNRLLSFTKWILFLVLLGALLFHYLHGLKSHKFHWDEYYFLKKSYYYDLLFIKKDLKDSRWYVQGAPDQPKLGPYFYGLSLHLSGVKDVDKTFQKINFNNLKINGQHWWEAYWSKELVNIPPKLIPILEFIWLGRNVSVFFTLASLIIVYIFAFKTKGALFALIAAGMLGFNSLMHEFGSRAMTDSMQLFFFFNNLLLSFIYLKFLKAEKSKKSMFLSILLGLNLAFGVGVKVSGILIAIYLSIFYLIITILYHDSKKLISHIALSFVITFSSFFIIFIALHPYIYKNTLQNFTSMFTNRMEVAEQYQVTYPYSAIYTKEDALQIIAERTLFPGGNYTNFNLRNFPADLLLFTLGIFLMVKKALSSLKAHKLSGELLIAIWTTVVMISLVFYLKNSWPRYFLPAVSVITLAQAYAIKAILQTAWAKIKKVRI